MKKRSRLILKIFSWIYYIMAALMVVTIIASFMSSSFLSDIALELEKQGVELGDVDLKITVAIVYGISAILLFIIGWLFSRVAKGKSNGLVLMVILGISAVSSLITFIKSISVSNGISLAIGCIALWAVYTARKK